MYGNNLGENRPKIVSMTVNYPPENDNEPMELQDEKPVIEDTIFHENNEPPKGREQFDR